MSENDKREHVRRLLQLWGATTQYCAERHMKMSEYQELIKSATGLAAMNVDGMPKGTLTGDPTARQAEQLAMLKERYSERVNDLWSDICERLAIAHSIESAMIDLNPVEHAVLKYRYEEKKTYIAIAAMLSYSEQSAKRLEAQAVDKVAANMDIKTIRQS